MSKSTIWHRAAKMAQDTPPERNRYVDLLRALSISAVVLGHWLMAAPFLDYSVALVGKPNIAHLLDAQPWSQWLTWIFQVMPVFFFVGGYSNGVSWDGAQRRGEAYSVWLEARMRRLLNPVIPLLLLWIIFGIVGYLTGVSAGMIAIGSQVALVPVWFLAIYLLIVMLVPVTREIWRRFGFVSVVVAIAIAALNDYLFFNGADSLKWICWTNYLLIWSAVHQLGYAWQEGRIGGADKVWRSFLVGIAGLISLVVLTQYGPYPTSLVGVPSQEISNTEAPKLPLMALAFAQIGFLLSLEGPVRRWLSNIKVWTSTVLLNGMIMPVFLWHSTIMMLLIGATFLLVPNVLAAFPGTAGWWLQRPLWILAYLLLMLAGLPLFLLLEKLATKTVRSSVMLWQLLLAAVLMCAGLALLAAGGIVGNGPMGINWIACCLPLVGIVITIPTFRSKGN